MLTDDQVAKINRGRDWPLQNFTRQQWADIADRLPEPPKPKACFRFLNAANIYWLDAPTPKKQTRLIAEAVEELNVTIEKVRTARPGLVRLVKGLSEIHGELQTHANIMRTEMAERPRGAHHNRHAFLRAALELWESCGGKPKRSRQSEVPSGPLIRYLSFVSQLVIIKEKPPELETLIRFIARYRKGN
jgi:hypothetical protein